MEISAQTKKRILFLLALLSIFASVKMLFFAYGLDEEYQLVMSYRQAYGDRLFYNMWEPHQSSAFLCAFLMKPYLSLIGTTGIVIYLRMCGLLLHALVGFYGYVVLKRYMDRENALLLALAYYDIIPKQIMMPEFGMMQVWGLTLLLLFMAQFVLEKRSRYLVYGALALVFMILSYPSCLILYPVVCIVLYFAMKANREGRGWGKAVGLFTIVCGICGVLYLGLLLRGRTLEELLQTISLILNGDVTHGSSVWTKAWSAGQNILYLTLLSLICFFVAKLLRKIKCFKDMPTSLSFMLVSFLVQLVFWVGLGSGYETMQLYLVTTSVVGIWSALQSTRGNLTYTAEENDSESRKSSYSIAADAKLSQTLFVSGTILCLVSLLAVLMLTDLTLMESLPHALPLAFLGLIMWISQVIQSEKGKPWGYIVLVAFCLTAVIGKGYTLRTGTGYNHVLQSRGIMKDGPAAGTISNYMGAYVYNCDYEDWQQYIENGDKVLIVVDQVMNLGTTQYLFKDVTISHFSIVNPTAYDERLIQYWEMFPEKAPNVIIVDCWYGDLMTDPNSYIMQYVENTFGYSQVNDGRYIRIFRK